VKQFYFGISMDTFDEISDSLQAHQSRAQILFEGSDERKTLDKALRLLEANGVQPLEFDIIRKGNPSVVRLYLSPYDMKSAILHLTEAGFTRLKGIDAKEAYQKKGESGISP
jgi:hypothetical protein